MLFGTEAPKFIYDPTGVPATVLLDYVVIDKDEPEEDVLIHKSVFTGHRGFILLGKYWIMEMKMHLYKLGEIAGVAYYKDILQYEGRSVRFYRHRDGDYLKDSSGNEVQMFLEFVTASNYQTPDYKDLLFLRFKSTKYVDLTQGLLA